MDLQLMTALEYARSDAKGGNPTEHFPIAGSRKPIDNEAGYWAGRHNDRIYLMAILFSYLYCKETETVADVGCKCSPLVLMLPGFKQRFAFDPDPDMATAWADVDGARFFNREMVQGDAQAVTGHRLFDLVLCNQVIEHLHNPSEFAHLLCGSGKRVIISTTFETRAGYIDEHVQDPISLSKFESWFPRKMLQCFIARGPNVNKIIAIF